MIDGDYTKHADYEGPLSQIEQCKPWGFLTSPQKMHLVSHKCSRIVLNFISHHQELPGMNMNKCWQRNIKWKE